MIADSTSCDNTSIYCESKDDKVFFSIQGAGEIYRIESTCEEFLKDAKGDKFDWDL